MIYFIHISTKMATCQVCLETISGKIFPSSCCYSSLCQQCYEASLETQDKISCENCSSTLDPVSDLDLYAKTIIKRKLQDLQSMLNGQEDITISALKQLTENVFAFRDNLDHLRGAPPSLQKEVRKYQSATQKSLEIESSNWLSLQQLISRRLQWVQATINSENVDLSASLVAIETWNFLTPLPEPKEYQNLYLWRHPYHERYPSLLPTDGWCLRPEGRVIGKDHELIRLPFQIGNKTFTFKKAHGVAHIFFNGELLLSKILGFNLTTKGFASMAIENARSKVTFYSLETGSPVIYHTVNLDSLGDAMIFKDSVITVNPLVVTVYRQDLPVVEIKVPDLGSPIYTGPYYGSGDLCCLRYQRGLVTIDMSTFEIVENPVRLIPNVVKIISLPGQQLLVYDVHSYNIITTDRIFDSTPNLDGNIYLFS
jgi:hypothetical protein